MPIDPISLKILGMIPNRFPDDISEHVIAMHGAIVGLLRPFRGKTKRQLGQRSDNTTGVLSQAFLLEVKL
jgi:hypothetical protein